MNTLERHGENLTVINYTDSGNRDNYGNIIYNSNSTDTKGIIEVTRQPEVNRDPASETVIVDAKIYISSDLYINDPSDASKASEVIRHSTGHTYEIEFVFDEGSGIKRLEGVRR